MFLQILSDLHGTLPKISTKADVLVFAGDVATTPRKVQEMFSKIRSETPAPIVYVLGNHEYYDNFFPDTLKDYRKALLNIPNVFLLEKEETVIGDLLVMGCTLWTDYDGGRGTAAALYGMNDFEFISVKTSGRLDVKHGGIRKVTPDDFIRAHNKSVAWLEDRLKSRESGQKVVVVTHHRPSFSLRSSKFAGSTLSGAFASNLDYLLVGYAPDLWVSGHEHTFKDVNLGLTRCVCNDFGYTGEQTHYKQEYLVEV